MVWTWFGRISFWQSHAIDLASFFSSLSLVVFFFFFLLNDIWVMVILWFCLFSSPSTLSSYFQFGFILNQYSDSANACSRSGQTSFSFVVRNCCPLVQRINPVERQPKRILQHWSILFRVAYLPHDKKKTRRKCKRISLMKIYKRVLLHNQTHKSQRKMVLRNETIFYKCYQFHDDCWSLLNGQTINTISV